MNSTLKKLRQYSLFSFFENQALTVVSRDTYQCKRNVCKKADKPSIMTKIDKVKPAHAAKIKKRIIPPTQLSLCKPFDNTMFHNTSDNSVRQFQNYKKNCLSRIMKIDAYEHGPMTKPTNEDKTLYAKWYSKHIQLCEWPDE